MNVQQKEHLMRFLALPLLGLLACGQTPKFDMSKFDRTKVAEYLRHAELWVPQLEVTIDDLRREVENFLGKVAA